MSMDKAINSGKERRKPYYGSKRFDYSCRCHGGCPWCESNHTHFDRKRRTVADKDLRDFRETINDPLWQDQEFQEWLAERLAKRLDDIEEEEDE